LPGDEGTFKTIARFAAAVMQIGHAIKKA